MAKKSIIEERIGAGMMLFQPSHKGGVISAVAGYFSGKQRKRGIAGRSGQVKATVGRVRGLNGYKVS